MQALFKASGGENTIRSSVDYGMILKLVGMDGVDKRLNAFRWRFRINSMTKVAYVIFCSHTIDHVSCVFFD